MRVVRRHVKEPWICLYAVEPRDDIIVRHSASTPSMKVIRDMLIDPI